MEIKECYVAIDVNDRLPEDDEIVSISIDFGKTFPYMGTMKFVADNYTHWLEKQTLYTLTKEEWDGFKSTLEQLALANRRSDLQTKQIENLQKQNKLLCEELIKTT